MKEIVTYLKHLNLSESESKLYLTLLRTGPISVRDLAVMTDIKRTTAYIYIEQLIDKGLVIKVVRGTQKQVAANSPENLESLVQQQVTSAKETFSQFSHVLSLITSTMPDKTEGEDMEITYIKGIAGIYNIYQEAMAGSEFRLHVNLALLKTLLYPNNVGLGYDLFEKGIRANKKLRIYEIISSTAEESKDFTLEETHKKGRYYYKFMPPKAGLTSPAILLYKNKVVIINGKDVPHAYVLHHKDYYENSVKLFDFIWDVLPGAKLEELE